MLDLIGRIAPLPPLVVAAWYADTRLVFSCILISVVTYGLHQLLRGE